MLNRQTVERAESGPGVEGPSAMTDGSAAISDAVHGRPVDVAGDRAVAFRTLVGTALDEAYHRATVLLGDRFEAEDAVHDAAEKAWRGWGGLRDPARFDAWFGRILVNTCRDRLRSRRRVQRIEVGSVSTGERSGPSHGDRMAELDQLREALAVLGPDERIVVVLRFESDLTVPAIAALLGVPEGTVKSRLHHALRKVRAELEGAER